MVIVSPSLSHSGEALSDSRGVAFGLSPSLNHLSQPSFLQLLQRSPSATLPWHPPGPFEPVPSLDNEALFVAMPQPPVKDAPDTPKEITAAELIKMTDEQIRAHMAKTNLSEV